MSVSVYSGSLIISGSKSLLVTKGYGFNWVHQTQSISFNSGSKYRLECQAKNISSGQPPNVVAFWIDKAVKNDGDYPTATELIGTSMIAVNIGNNITPAYSKYEFTPTETANAYLHFTIISDQVDSSSILIDDIKLSRIDVAGPNYSKGYAPVITGISDAVPDYGFTYLPVSSTYNITSYISASDAYKNPATQSIQTISSVYNISSSIATSDMHHIKTLSSAFGITTDISAELIPPTYTATSASLTVDGFSYLTDISFANDAVGWVIGSRQQIFKTTDGGSTWVSQSHNLTNYTFYTVNVFDENNVTIGMGNGQTINQTSNYLKTTDGGSTWVSQSIGSNTYPYQMNKLRFYDANHGWAGGTSNNQISYTNNGGSTWITGSAGSYPEYSSFTSISTLNQTTAVIGNGYGRMYKTTDGTNWNKIYDTNNTNYVIYGCQYYDVNTIHAVCSDGGSNTYYLKSNNGGSTWISKRFSYYGSYYDRLYNIKFTSQNVGWITNMRGIIYHTIDGGLNWSIITDVVNNYTYNYNRIASIGNSFVWVAGLVSSGNGIVIKYSKV